MQAGACFTHFPNSLAFVGFLASAVASPLVPVRSAPPHHLHALYPSRASLGIPLFQAFCVSWGSMSEIPFRSFSALGGDRFRILFGSCR